MGIELSSVSGLENPSALEVLDALSQLQFESGEMAPALETTTRWVAFDAFNEAAHRRLMEIQLGMGERLAAIQAAAHPAHTNYLYFVVLPCGNGKEVFDSSYQQFLRDSERYQAARTQHGGRSPTHC